MNNIKKLLGKRIQELRKSKRITQQQLADFLDIDQRSLSAIECGVNFPSKSLLKIAEAFNIELKDLFDFEHIDMTENMLRENIIKQLDNLNLGNLKIIYRLIKSMD